MVIARAADPRPSRSGDRRHLRWTTSASIKKTKLFNECLIVDITFVF
jgi:hypothetical protein